MTSTILSDKLLAKIRLYFSPTILVRGYHYYLNQAIHNVYEEKEGVFKANVQGSKLYTVRLNLDSLSSSTCSCPYGYHCKHMAAVLFETGLPHNQLLGAGNKGLIAFEQGLQKGPTPAKKTGKTSTSAAVQESGTVADWHAYFEQEYGEQHYYSPYSLETRYEQMLGVLLPYADEWDPAIRLIYQIHVHLFILHMLDRFYGAEGTRSVYYDYSMFYGKIGTRCIQKVVECLNQWQQADTEDPRYEEHLVGTIQLLAKYAFPQEKSLGKWSFLYRHLWWILLYREEWMEAERVRLQKERAAGGSAIYQDLLLMGLIHFQVMDGDDERAMEMAAEMKDSDVGQFADYLPILQGLRQWERLVKWLKWMRKGMRRSRILLLSTYMNYWQEVSRVQGSEMEWRETVTLLLPHSYSYYANHLMEEERHQEWVDLSLMADRSLLEVNPAHLKQVDAQNPSVILPFYHLAVERYVLEKKRDSYKQAVKVLKKLQKCYQRLGKQERWQSYIQYISKQYARYRAFQEELRKGKLIS